MDCPASPRRHLPGLDLGALAGVAGLREAAAAKLGAQQAQQLAALALSLAALEAAVSDLRSAAGVHTEHCLGAAGEAHWRPDPRPRLPFRLAAGTLEELLERERAAPILQDRPVFAALSLPTLCEAYGWPLAGCWRLLAAPGGTRVFWH